MSSVPIPDSTGLIVDLFAGGGGASIGIEAALGEHVDIAINHDAEAIAVHKANHPRTKHFQCDIWEIDPVVATEAQPVKFLHASPDCKHFSRAKGDVPKSHHIRALADVVLLWARKTLPLVVTMENVQEFPSWGPLGPDGKPIKKLAGEFYDQWRAEFVALGYIVDTKVLDASEYGAPTKRLRWFMVARRDGQPITWPRATHGKKPGLQPLHTAAECLDWKKPIKSIFDRKKPLAAKTLKRIAAGIQRYVLNNPTPFVVPVDDERVAMMAPTLVQTSYGERPGQRPRYLDLHAPLGTIVAQGQKHALVATFLAKHFGGVVGTPVTVPFGTITQKDHHAVVTASLVKFHGTSDAHDGAASVDQPLPTISASGNHAAVVTTKLERAAFFIEYYGQGSGLTGAAVDRPLPTITTKARFALVTVEGVEYVVTDICMRMVDGEELARAQFGKYAKGFNWSKVKTKTGMNRLIGNSVPPEMEEALVGCNRPDVSGGWDFSARLAAA